MSGPADEAQWRPFVSSRGRAVAFCTAVATAAVLTTVAVVAPAPAPGVPRGWHVYDRAVVIAFGLVVAAFLSRFGTVRATPGPDGLRVRNLFGTRTLAWAEILSVQFGPDRPWVQLALTDTEHVPVMAIQKADGARAHEEARRLATYVARLGQAGEPGGAAR